MLQMKCSCVQVHPWTLPSSDLSCHSSIFTSHSHPTKGRRDPSVVSKTVHQDRYHHCQGGQRWLASDPASPTGRRRWTRREPALASVPFPNRHDCHYGKQDTRCLCIDELGGGSRENRCIIKRCQLCNTCLPSCLPSVLLAPRSIQPAPIETNSFTRECQYHHGSPPGNSNTPFCSGFYTLQGRRPWCSG